LEDEANDSEVAASEFLAAARRFPVLRSPQDAAGGSRTPGVEALRAPGTADEIGATRWRMLALPQLAPCKSGSSAGVRETFPSPGRRVRCPDSAGPQPRDRRSSFGSIPCTDRVRLTVRTPRLEKYSPGQGIPLFAEAHGHSLKRLARAQSFLRNVPSLFDFCFVGTIGHSLRATPEAWSALWPGGTSPSLPGSPTRLRSPDRKALHTRARE